MSLWFTEELGNKIGRITTGGVVTTEYTIPTGNSAPAGIAPAQHQMLWVAEFSANKIGALPATLPLSATHDFNGELKSDILWRDSSGNLALWLMNGAAR